MRATLALNGLTEQFFPLSFLKGVLSLDAPSYILPTDTEESEDEHSSSNVMPHHKKEIGKRIYKKVNSMWPVCPQFFKSS